MDRQEQIDHILDHYEHPRNCGELADATISQEGRNPGCGDRITIHLRLRGSVVEAATFMGEGCTISLSAASMTTDLLVGLSIEEVEEVVADRLLAQFGEEIASTRPKCIALALGAAKQGIRAYRLAELTHHPAPVIGQPGRLEETH